MKFIFDISTPENCISCPFKEVRVSSGYGPLKIKCIIDPELDISASDALRKRSDQCPGITEEENNMTRMDAIKQMSIEEFAQFLDQACYGPFCNRRPDCDKLDCIKDCIIGWLNEEVKDAIP